MGTWQGGSSSGELVTLRVLSVWAASIVAGVTQQTGRRDRSGSDKPWESAQGGEAVHMTLTGDGGYILNNTVRYVVATELDGPGFSQDQCL